MKAALRFVLLGVTSAIVVFSLLQIIPGTVFSGPDTAFESDDRMWVRFALDSPDFERLVAMFEQDSTVARIAPLDPTSGQGLPLSRRLEYERLFRKLSLHGGIHRSREDGDQGAIFLRSRALATRASKGYAYVPDIASAPAILSTDESTSEIYKSWGRIYRPMRGRWYIYYLPGS